MAEGTQSAHGVFPLDIFIVREHVKREPQAVASGRDAKGTDGREFSTVVLMPTDRGLSPGSQGPAQGSEQGKARCSEANQRGSPAGGFFLRAGSPRASSARSRPQRARGRGARAVANSPVGAARESCVRVRGDRRCPTPAGSPPRLAYRALRPAPNRGRVRLVAASASILGAAPWLSAGGLQGEGGQPDPQDGYGPSPTTGRVRAVRHQEWGRSLRAIRPVPLMPLRAASGAPMLLRSREASCNPL